MTVWDWLLSPWAMGVLGLTVGSFLNVVIYRKPQMLEREWLGDAAAFLQDREGLQRILGDNAPLQADLGRQGQALADALAGLPRLNLSTPRSRCPACGNALRWWDNIPVLAWLRLRGRCASCTAPISARYPLVELLTAGLFAATAAVHGPSAATAVYALALALLVTAAFIDLDTTLLPDDLTLPLIALGVLAAWQRWTPVTLPDAALGALFGYLALWSVATAYRWVRGVQGMAEGDFKLLAGLGALLGWQALPSIVLLSSSAGAAAGLYLMVARGHRREVPIPFGPYLAAGGLAALFFGPQLARWWSI